MRWMKCGVMALSLTLCVGCASQSKDSRNTGSSPAASRPSAAEASQGAPTTNTQILLDKIKADKKLLVASNMDLTDAEAEKFWPLYDEYQQDLGQINQRLGQTVMDYADAYKKGHIPDETAAKLLDEALAVEESEVKLKEFYAQKFEAVMPAAKVARYLQIETKIRSLLRLDLAENIPLVH
ncbi:MAG TPA: hypothetical protein VFG71_03665 [Nitrospiraceae bacterium]|nr:hypothetical protein [Nitrospiraceae bacterium]